MNAKTRRDKKRPDIMHRQPGLLVLVENLKLVMIVKQLHILDFVHPRAMVIMDDRFDSFDIAKETSLQ